VPAKDVLRQFKQTAVHMVIVIGEHGGAEGIITLNDIVEEVLGDVDRADPEITTRADGSWLVDGHLPIDRLTDVLTEFAVPEGESSEYTTLAGFVLKRLGHIPDESEAFGWQNYRFEVVDMDGKRIDKVLVQRD
jgi:putative hemolysin